MYFVFSILYLACYLYEQSTDTVFMRLTCNNICQTLSYICCSFSLPYIVLNSNFPPNLQWLYCSQLHGPSSHTAEKSCVRGAGCFTSYLWQLDSEAFLGTSCARGVLLTSVSVQRFSIVSNICRRRKGFSH